MGIELEKILLPKEWASNGAFLLKVAGHHLEDAHILDGDYVLVQPQLVPMAGDLVAIRVDDQASVQRYQPGMDVLGKVMGVMRVMRPRQ